MRTTIARPVELSGIGVHSGLPAVARIAPAAAGTGLTLNGSPLGVELIADGRFATRLNTPNGDARTVEHLLAALFGLGITDAAVAVVGEAPILDGSARCWVEAIAPRTLGQPAPRWVLDAPVEVRIGDALASASPADGFSADITIEFPELGRQRCQFDLSQFRAQIAPARTFGFLADAPRMRAAGLALGADLSNTVVFDGGGCLNPEGLRFVDEPVRHKGLDLLGDLATLGAPIAAHITVHKGGHRLHHLLVRRIAEVGRLDLPRAS